MTIKYLKYLILFWILVPAFSFGLNQHRIDSLQICLSKATHDTVKCSILRELFSEYIRTNVDKAAGYNEQSLKLARKINYLKGIAEAIYNQSTVFSLKGKYDSALAVVERAKPVFRELSDSVTYADFLGNVGYLYSLKNDPKNALINLLEALKIYKLTGSRKNLALLYNRFGSLYRNEKMYDSALFYFHESLKINDAEGFKLGSSVNLVNIGTLYENKSEHLKAIGYFKQALDIKRRLGDKQGIGKCFNNIGAAYMNLGEVDSAIEYHEKALVIAMDFHSNLDVAMIYINIGFDYQKRKDYARAIQYAMKGQQMAKQINDLNLIRESSRVLFECYEALGKFKEAYQYHLLFKKFSDSIVNENNLKALAEIQAKYNYATKENEITSLKIAKNKQQLQIQTLRAWYSLAIGLFFALVALALFFYYRSRASRKLSLKLKEINEMKSHFFANLSHEFRTPLTLMLGPAEKLMETASPADKPWLELIHRNARRLLFLDEQLLEFTKIDSGTQKINLVSGNILHPLKSIAESFILMAEQKSIRYSYHIPTAPVEVCFDPDILEKVTVNILSNAFKYTPAPGSIDFTVSIHDFGQQPVDSDSLQVTGAYVRIDVKDSGIGVPENKKEQIFERFYQLNHNPGNTVGGVGIGLALTRELLLLHHGFITMESTEGKGSAFSVFLPLDRSIYTKDELNEVAPYVLPGHNDAATITLNELQTLPSLTEKISVESQDENSFPQVLVVDDNADMRIYIREVLQTGYTVTDVESGDKGYEIACNMVPDLIVTDVMMYPMDGIEFCRKVKQDERTSHIPVIMLTALSGVQEKVKGLETGADDYIAKPFSSRELMVRIRNLIAQRNKLREIFSSAMNIEPGAITVTSADEKFLKKLILLIEENIDNPELDNEFLLRNIAMSRSQLHRKIKALTGEPITGFIRIIRIKRAAQLLEQKFGNVSEVMYAVGFNNLSYFTKSFREVYHMTPSEFMTK